ncbi:hypothetical protein ACSZOC_04485 [Aeromonas hydrophila]
MFYSVNKDCELSHIYPPPLSRLGDNDHDYRFINLRSEIKALDCQSSLDGLCVKRDKHLISRKTLTKERNREHSRLFAKDRPCPDGAGSGIACRRDPDGDWLLD